MGNKESSSDSKTTLLSKVRKSYQEKKQNPKYSFNSLDPSPFQESTDFRSG